MKCSSVRLILWFLLLSIVLASPPAHAVTYVRIADQDLADQSPVIAEVRVLAVDPSPGAARPVTDYQVEIVDLISGYLPGSSIVVRVAGGRLPDGGGLYVPGAPRFVEGETALLFLGPRADGTYQIRHLMLGAFRIAELDGGQVAQRDLSEAHELLPPGEQDREPERLRDLERFRAWLEDRARGTERPADYWLEAPADGLPIPFEKYRLLGPGRWTTFDGGGSQEWRAHSGGQPGQPGGGFTQFSRALAAWTNHPTTPIRYTYGGTTSATGGMTTADNVNGILFDDPNDLIDDVYSCATGGVLARGGFWYGGQHNHNGTTFLTIREGDIVTNDGIACTFPGNKKAEELFAHELGHTLGLGHSSDSGALMWFYIHNDGRGARLSTDDKNGIIFIYGDPPAAPSELEAEVRDEDVRLTWRDNSNDETKFEVWRSSGGGFSRVRVTTANTTSWLDTGVEGGTTYTYRTRAANAAGFSDWSNDAIVTMPGLGTPADLDAFAVSDSQIRLFWTDNSTIESGFEIEGKTGADPFTLLQTVPADAETADVGGLSPATTYTFRVRAVGEAGATDYSNEASTITFFSDPEPCVPGPHTLCLNDGRFKVELTWTNYVGQSGPGTDSGLPATDSGLFYYNNPNNWEMLVKVLDGCASDTRHFWVFAAAATTVAYDLVVTDTVSGFSRTYTNEIGVAASPVFDTSAFATCFAEVPAPAPVEAGGPGPKVAPPDIELEADCVPSDTRFCLNGGRFAVELEWTDFADESGVGRTDPFDSVDSGLMWFFDPQNLEMLVKVLDGCAINNRVWVFGAAVTNVEYTLRVTDTVTGATREYPNELGHAADAITDTLAFDSCD